MESINQQKIRFIRAILNQEIQITDLSRRRHKIDQYGFDRVVINTVKITDITVEHLAELEAMDLVE